MGIDGVDGVDGVESMSFCLRCDKDLDSVSDSREGMCFDVALDPEDTCLGLTLRDERDASVRTMMRVAQTMWAAEALRMGRQGAVASPAFRQQLRLMIAAEEQATQLQRLHRGDL